MPEAPAPESESPEDGFALDEENSGDKAGE